MTYRVLNPFRDRRTGELVKGGEWSGPPDQAQRLVRAGCLAIIRTDAPETATADHAGVERAVSVDQYHTGSGWYEIPGVGKVRGRTAAEEALR